MAGMKPEDAGNGGPEASSRMGRRRARILIADEALRFAIGPRQCAIKHGYASERFFGREKQDGRKGWLKKP